MQVPSRGIPLKKKKFLLRDSDRSGFTHRNVELFLEKDYNGPVYVGGDEFDMPPPSDRLYPGEADISPGDVCTFNTAVTNIAPPNVTIPVQNITPTSQISLFQVADNANQYDYNQSILYVQGTHVITQLTTAGLVSVLSDGAMQLWSSSTSMTYWTVVAGGNLVQTTSSPTPYQGTYCAGISTAYNAGFSINQNQSYPKWAGNLVTFGMFVWCNTQNVAQLYVNGNPSGQKFSAFHPGNSSWVYLVVSSQTLASDSGSNYTLNCYSPNTMNGLSAFFCAGSATYAVQATSSASGYPVVLNIPNPIASSFNGDLCTVQGVGSSLVLQNGTGLQLYTPSIQINSGTMLNLIYNTALASWVETSRMGPNFNLMGAF